MSENESVPLHPTRPPVADSQAEALEAHSLEAQTQVPPGSPPPGPSAFFNAATAPEPPINMRSLMGLTDALLHHPAKVAEAYQTHREGLPRLFLLILIALTMTSLVMASFEGGYQFIAVPIKVTVATFLASILCIPSLYVFGSLSSVQHSLRAVISSLCIGLAVQAILLCALAPIAWVFSQSSESVAFMGGLYIVMFLVSCVFGLGITRQLLTQHAVFKTFWIWQVVYIVVALQLATTLRPLVGPYSGSLAQEKMFFLAHWIHVVGS